MFLNHIKNFFTKKIVKKNLSQSKIETGDGKIQTVGIVFDETYFYEKQDLIAALVQQGINPDLIQVLVFKDKVKKNERLDCAVFSHKDLSWAATFTNSDVKEFIAQKFDLLINYYDTEKSPLLLVSNLSKARFKVGFASIDKTINHFMIETHAENYKVFVQELFKYLRILKKI